MVQIICQEFLMNSKSLLKIFASIIGFFIFCSVSFAVPVDVDEATDWVNRKGHKLIETLSNSDIEAKYTILDEMFNEDIDTEHMARFVIGKYWRTMDSNQQQTYIDLFFRYALSLYKNYPLNFDTQGIDFKILSVKQDKKFTDVTCSITLPKEYATETMKSINAKFKLTKKNEKIKIVDLIFAQSSLLSTYRTRFYEMITELDEDMDWFLEDFNDMVTSSEKTAQEKAENY